ncbi:MAG TPA: DUF2017 domain-containing protein [Frankiaceae bacterium]|nr:DUF2017 domain-containing protein [Frankiaceae bacterium]
MSTVRRTRLGIAVLLDPVETAVLAQVINEMSELIGSEPAAPDGEAWARDLGLAGLGEPESAPTPPSDPISSRLFPDAYTDDAAAADDFRRFTETELRAAKFGNAIRLLDSLPEGGGELVLDDEGSAAWLGALNDARLALGTALDVDQDTADELATLEVDDPRAPRLSLYVWLGELQDSLLWALTGD